MSTIIQCPNCQTKYRLKIVIAEGQQVRCPSCQSVWRHSAVADNDAMQPRMTGAETSGEEPGGAASPFRDAAKSAPLTHINPVKTARPETLAHQPHASGNAFAHNRSGYDDAGPPLQDGSPDDRAQGEDLRQAAFEQQSGTLYNRGEDAGAGSGNDPFYSEFDEAQAANSSLSDDELQAADTHFERDSSGHRTVPEGFAHEMAEVLNRANLYQDQANDDPDEAEPDFRSQTWDNPAGGRLYGDDQQPLYGRGGFAGDDGGGQPGDGLPDDDGFDAARQAGEAADAADAETLSASRLDSFWDEQRGGLDDEREKLRAYAPSFQARDAMQAQMASQPEKRRGGLAVAAAWATYLAVMGGLAASLISFRDSIVQAMPGAAHYYAQLGFKTMSEPLGFEDVVYEIARRDDRSVLEVRGAVVNKTNGDITVPLLYITVRDDQNEVIANTVAVIVKEPLAASAKATFTLEFLSPPPNLSEIQLRFGKPG